MILVATVTATSLLVRQRCRWFRAIWYVPGATFSIDGGAELPITRRALQFAREHDIVFRGRVVAECGEGTDPFPGGSDLERRGPGFTVAAGLDQGGTPMLYLVPGARTIRLHKVAIETWDTSAVPLTKATFGLQVERFVWDASSSFSGAVTCRPNDADADATFYTGTAPAATGITAQAYTSGPGLPGIGYARLAVLPNNGSNAPQTLELGEGLTAYPATPDRKASGLAIRCLLSAGDFLNIRAHCTEELF